MKELIILGESNGSGKSTYAKEYLLMHNYTFLNADEIAAALDHKEFRILFRVGNS